MPKNYRWAAQRVQEVWSDEGLPGITSRGSSYVRRRMTGADSRARLPRDPVRGSGWPLSVVMVAAAHPEQCFHYRVQQKQEICEILGVPFRLVEPESPTVVADAVQLASVLIVYRLGEDPTVLAAIREARRLGIPVIFETDDAVYRRDLLEDDPNLLLVPRSLRKSVVRGADKYAAVIALADHALASTEALAADLGHRVAGASFVIDNGIDATMLAVAEAVGHDPAPPLRDPATVRIGYGSGSRAHDYDLALAAPGLVHVLEKFPHVELFFMGPVTVPRILERFEARIRLMPSVTYVEYLRQLNTCDISVAPLADFSFNHFKSQVKYLESALLQVPFVASPTVYSRYVKDGDTGLLAEPNEWGSALTTLVTQPSRRDQLARNARMDVTQYELGELPVRQFARMLEALA